MLLLLLRSLSRVRLVQPHRGQPRAPMSWILLGKNNGVGSYFALYLEKHFPGIRIVSYSSFSLVWYEKLKEKEPKLLKSLDYWKRYFPFHESFRHHFKIEIEKLRIELPEKETKMWWIFLVSYVSHSKLSCIWCPLVIYESNAFAFGVLFQNC